MTWRRVLLLTVGLVIVIVGGVVGVTRLLSATTSDSPRAEVSEGAGESPSPSWSPPVRTIDGTGYSYTLASLWYDVTEDATSSPKVTEYLDSSGQWGNGRANVVVYGPYEFIDRSLESVRDQTRANLRATFDVEIDVVPPREFDGAEALGLHLVRRLSKDFLSDENYWIVGFKDASYVIVSRRKAGDRLATKQFEQMFATWRWDGNAAKT